jgi:hypothetical protein
VSEFTPEEILRILNKHGVRYVLIGGLAATFYGSVTPTFDVDITPEMTMANLARLSAALTELEARIRVEGIPDGLPFSHDATSLMGITTLNVVTKFGPLDLATQPAGVTSFADWDAGARDLTISGIRIRLADLADIVRSKEAANRDKDKAQLPLLRSLLERLRRRAE